MTHHLWAGHIAQVVECLPSLHEALGLTSSIILGMVYVYNPTAFRTRKRKFEVTLGDCIQGQSGIHKRSPVLKKKKNKYSFFPD